jgi:glycine reductase
MRVVHYINQFFAGVGGEDSAATGPSSAPEAKGPGRKLASLLGDDHQIVATVWCGDDYAVGNAGAIDEILALIQAAEPDLVIAGPAFTSGRYGLACARVVAAATAAGLSAVAAMHPDNPGLDEAGTAPVVASGEVARSMGPTLQTLAGAAVHLLEGAELTADDGRIGRLPRLSVFDEQNAATRAVDLVLARLGGDRDATEVPLPRFDQVTPAAPIDDPSAITIAFVTEGGLVPDANPGGLESARATRWLRYPIGELPGMASGEWRSVHGGFSTVHANADPNRILPLDAARQLEEEGRIGSVMSEYFVTTGNGTSVANARRFGVEWAADIRRSGARAAILTST